MPDGAGEELLGELVDVRSGRRLARFRSTFAARVGAGVGAQAAMPADWAVAGEQAAKPPFVTAVGAFDPPRATDDDLAPLIAACASDANALAIATLAAGSDCERGGSPIGLVVAELDLHYGQRGDAVSAAYDVRTRLLGRSRKALTPGHHVCDPAGGQTLAFVRSVCVFFSHESRRAVPIPFPLAP